MSTSLGKDLGRSQGTDFYGIDDCSPTTNAPSATGYGHSSTSA